MLQPNRKQRQIMSSRKYNRSEPQSLFTKKLTLGRLATWMKYYYDVKVGSARELIKVYQEKKNGR